MVNIFFARLTFPFSMQLLPISSFRFLCVLKAVIGIYYSPEYLKQKSWQRGLFWFIFIRLDTIIKYFSTEQVLKSLTLIFPIIAK